MSPLMGITTYPPNDQDRFDLPAECVAAATQHDTHPWLASVQWHPELTADRDPTQQRLFDAFVCVAQERM